MIKKTLKTFFFLTALLAICPKNAFAYFDPGLGSYLLQLLVGAILAIVCFFRNIRDCFLSLIKKKPSKKKKED